MSELARNAVSELEKGARTEEGVNREEEKRVIREQIGDRLPIVSAKKLWEVSQEMPSRIRALGIDEEEFQRALDGDGYVGFQFEGFVDLALDDPHFAKELSGVVQAIPDSAVARIDQFITDRETEYDNDLKFIEDFENKLKEAGYLEHELSPFRAEGEANVFDSTKGKRVTEHESQVAAMGALVNHMGKFLEARTGGKFTRNDFLKLFDFQEVTEAPTIFERVKDAVTGKTKQVKKAPPKGMVKFLEDGKALITAFKGGDMTTIIHESGHLVRRLLYTLNERMPGTFEEDIRTLEESFGVRGKGKGENVLYMSSYPSKAATLDEFIKEALASPDSDHQPFFHLGDNKDIKIVADRVKHIDNKHGFKEWERIPEVIEKGEKILVGKSDKTAHNAYVHVLDEGESSLVVISADTGGKREKTLVLTAFRDSSKGVRNWIENRSAASSIGSSANSSLPPQSGEVTVSKIEEEVKGILGEGEGNELYQSVYRGSARPESADNGRGYTMWASGGYKRVASYGGHDMSRMWKLDVSDAVDIQELMPEIVKFMKEDFESGRLDYTMARDIVMVANYIQEKKNDAGRSISLTETELENNPELFNEAIEKYAEGFDPKDIVDNAEHLEEGFPLTWLFDRILEPKDILTFKTNEGAISFDKAGQNLKNHNPNDPDILYQSAPPLERETPRGSTPKEPQINSRDFPAFGEEELDKIVEQYERHIGRTSTYRGNLAGHIERGASVFMPFKSKGDTSALVGQFRNGVFFVSHFAPTSLRKGKELVEYASNSKMPVVFAVTDHLGGMLEKIPDLKYYGTVPQFWQGEIVEKQVFLNKTAMENLPTNIEEIFKEEGDTYYQEQSRSISDDTPTENGWTRGTEEAFANAVSDFLVGNFSNQPWAQYPHSMRILNQARAIIMNTYNQMEVGEVSPEIRPFLDELLLSDVIAGQFRSELRDLGRLYEDKVISVDRGVQEHQNNVIEENREDNELEAREDAEKNPNREVIKKVIEAGGINEESLLMRYSKEDVDILKQEHPDLIKESGLDFDEIAQEFGMEAEDLVTLLQATPSIDVDAQMRLALNMKRDLASEPPVRTPTDVEITPKERIKSKRIMGTPHNRGLVDTG